MSVNNNDNIFRYIAEYSGLLIELISDKQQLLRIDFIKEKKIKNNDTLAEPLKKVLSFLDDYFRGNESKIKIILNSEFLKNKSVKNTDSQFYLDMNGFTEKEIKIYSELLKVKSGKTVSYSELAMRSGIARGARFAGNCMAANRFPVIIPCHRVIKRDGSIGNYSGGEGIKEFLLKHEMDNHR